MVEELEALRNAAQLLAVRTGEDRDELLHASETFWSALYRGPEWPSQVRDEVIRLADVLMAGGSVEATLGAVDERTAEGLASEIVAAARRIEGHLQVPV